MPQFHKNSIFVVYWEIRVIRIAAPYGRLMALFFIFRKSESWISYSFTYFNYFNAQRAERRNFMSAIIHLMGRVTKDPVMQQGRNNGTEYISLDLATSQKVRMHRIIRKIHMNLFSISAI